MLYRSSTFRRPLNLLYYDKMPNPLQCLYYRPFRDNNKADILLAASGPQIFSFNVSEGSLLSTWPATAGLEEGTERFLQSGSKVSCKSVDSVVEEESASRDEDADRLGKRRKLSRHGSGSESASTEIVVQEHSKSSDNSASTPTVIKLTGSSNGQYVVAVTGEDKCIRVFELHQNGTLVENSKR